MTDEGRGGATNAPVSNLCVFAVPTLGIIDFCENFAGCPRAVLRNSFDHGFHGFHGWIGDEGRPSEIPRAPAPFVIRGIRAIRGLHPDGCV